MSETPVMVGFKYGDFNALPDSTINGTIYVAKAADGKAYMYVDKNGEKLNITSPNATFYGVAEWVDEETINVNLDGFTLEIGSQITIKMPEWYDTNDIATAVIIGTTYLSINNEFRMKLTMRAGAKRTLLANSIWTFVYDGTSWQLIGEVDTINNGMVISTQTTIQTVEGGDDWDNWHAPLLVGNVAAASVNATGYYPSVKAMYKDNITPTLGKGGILRVPGTLRVGNTDDNNGSITINGYVTDGSGYTGDRPQTVVIDGEKLHWYSSEGDMSIYLNSDSIRISDDYSGYGVFFEMYHEENGGGITYHGGDISASNGFIYDTVGRLPHVYYGTTAPSSSTGQNGDIYIMYS